MTTPISPDELRHAIEGGLITIVDALPPAYFSEQHLPGAINLVEAGLRVELGAVRRAHEPAATA